jgi:hypothetical protein
MSTRNLSRGNRRPARKAEKLTAIYEQTVYKMWEPQPLATLRASTACREITLSFMQYALLTLIFECSSFCPEKVFYMFRMILAINSDYGPRQHEPVGFRNGYAVHFVCCRNWIFKYYAGELSLNGSELRDGERSINRCLILLNSVCSVLLTLSEIYLEHISNQVNKTSTIFSELYPFLGYHSNPSPSIRLQLYMTRISPVNLLWLRSLDLDTLIWNPKTSADTKHA